MRIAALIPLVGCICNVLLAFFVLSRAPRAIQNRVYFFLGLFISVWNLGQFFAFTTQDRDAALFWVRFIWFGVVFIPTLLFHLSMLLTQTRLGRLIFAAYAFPGILALTIPTRFFIRGVHPTATAGWYADAGPGLHLAMLPFALMFIAIIILVRTRRELSKLHRSRLTALIIAQSMLATLGTNDTLPLLDIANYPFTTTPVYPYGSVAAVFYGVMVAYSVLQHQLLDVQIGLSRVAAQVVRMAFLTVCTLGLLLAATLIFPSAFNLLTLSIAMGVFIVSIVVASLAFPRLFGGKGLEKLERRILGDRFEYQERVRVFIDNMAWYHDLPELLEDLNRVLTTTFRITSYQVITRDEAHRAFSLIQSYPDDPERRLAELNFSTSVLQYFEWENAEYLLLNEQGPGWRGPTHLEKQARQALSAFSADICFPLSWENEPFGILLVGPKNNGDPYTSTDISLLVSLVKNMSLMVNQFRLKTQILQTQELDLLGRMSRGMAHDLNNLLTPVWTLLELSNEAGDATVDAELLPVALRNVKTMRAYIREALFFSENLRPDMQLGRLDLVVRNAIETATNSRKKHIEVAASTPGEVLVEIDEVLIQRLIANLIANAIDASREGEKVQVHLEWLPNVEAGREWLRLSIIDHGEGIPKENLSRILTPYFTTKNRGDENRGFGLGLAICRKIVTLHGGSLAISSQIRKGTTVQVDLPARQVKPAPPTIKTAAAS